MSEGYRVRVRRLNVPTWDALLTRIGELPVTEMVFDVELDEADRPQHGTIKEQIEAARYQAALDVADAIFNHADWYLPQKYLITVEGQHPRASRYEADIHVGSVGLRRADPDVW